MKKFWITTGLYPQEILIDLGGTKSINEVKFTVSGARKVMIEGCKTTNASEFKRVGESKGKCNFISNFWFRNFISKCNIILYVDLPNKSGGITTDSVRLSEPAPYSLLKFVI